MNTRMLYIISDIEKSLAFEWIAGRFENDLTFILIGKRSTSLSKFLIQHSINVVEISDQEYTTWMTKWIGVFKVILKLNPQVVHTHLWRANLIGLTASWLLRVPRRIFTRHHATIHYDKFPAGLKWDKLCNWLATDIVAISKNVRKILVEWDGVDQKKVHLIHHGFDLEYFANVDEGRVHLLRVKYSIQKEFNWPVIGVIARYLDLKGIQFVIPAFIKIRNKYPNAHLILANAHGEYRNEINVLLKGLPSSSYTEIKFEEDLAALYRLFDVYVHAPINPSVEAFGQTYVEALACGIPSVFTLSGVAPEFIVHEKNALVCDFRNSLGLVELVLKLLGDSDLQRTVVEGGFLAVRQFSLNTMLEKLGKVYIKNSQP
jgi:glycosyltransferase involved in cell wall biosynthesis